ncbi:hypothetical protein BBI15_13650 [Planococcus plakortidis]|uniref:2-keto-4-pentenoate hydratase n=1 Tax=Planococcus plakortidis TaxID=1038856 RepID=A0A1C7EBT1_9BACL|nr:hypothetical protein [Planococcus plakortidis]ANU21155.1 hypothetical protein BBI15_13650 [Planococcus plakortidis]
MASFESEKQEYAERLYRAYDNRQAVGKEQVPESLNPRLGYEIQQAVLARKEQQGEPLAGYKISLTSPETQQLFNSGKPLYGALTAPAISGDAIELSSMLSPLIEIELMFLIQEDINADDSTTAILEKTLVAPGIEVPDSRFTEWFPNITLGQVIADSAVAGRIVVGKPAKSRSYDQLDQVRGELFLDGEPVASGSSSEVLGHPVNAIKWLATELEAHGLKLKRGLTVSSGTFILPKPLEKGRYEAKYEGIGSVELTVR